MDEKRIADAEEIGDENLEGATGGTRANGSIHIICELDAEAGSKSEDEGDDTMPPNPFVCPLCRKPIQFCKCHK